MKPAKRILELSFVAIIFALLVVPAINMVRPFLSQEPLYGVVANEQRPPLRLADVGSEEFQRRFSRWFDKNYGIRPTAARIDNSINYHVFHETRAEQPVKVGPSQMLFLNEQLWFHNRHDDPRAGIERFARAARKAQDLLAARGKSLVVMVIPSKTTVYRESVPSEWTLPLPTPRPCDEQVYGAFVRQLVREGVTFVDGRALVDREFPPEKRDRVYSRTGRHLNAVPACRLVQDALDLARPQVQGATIPPIDCSYTMGPATDFVQGEETDLHRLLNIWTPRPNVPIAYMTLPPERIPVSERADLLVVGSSFAWRTVFEAERNKAFGRIHLFYYNKTVVDRDGRPFYPVPSPKSEEWRRLVFEKKVFLLPTPEEFLPDHNGDFLQELIDALSE